MKPGPRRFLQSLMATTAVLLVPIGAAEPPWKLVWSDEFDGERLDFNKWAVEENAHGGGNAEQQFYVERHENVRVENGCLVLEARREVFELLGEKRDYTSGRIRTKHRADWKYGRVDVRAKLPVGQGLWSAVWMLPTHEPYGGWAASGEIDIMECLGHEPNTVLGNLHYGGRWPDNVHTGKSFVLENGTFAEEFHVFSLEWEERTIRWYVDGALYQTQTEWRSDGGPYPAPFDVAFHLILNVAVGGRLSGLPDASTTFPQRMLVDYVRVSQRGG